MISQILLYVLLAAATCVADPIEEIGQGPPKLMDGVLHPNAYKPATAKQLAHPELLWFNFNWARERGYDVPAEGATPEFLQKIYGALALQIPSENDPASAFLNGSVEVHADGYGADDTVNLGSGRAASWGKVQSKGIGRTAHVRDPDPWHSNGAAFIAEGLKEAFLSEIVHSEFKHGGNRIVAVIATGTYAPTKGNDKVPRVLIIREDPTRPAQFIRNYAATTDAEIAWDKRRVESVIHNLANALPQPPGAHFTDPAAKLESGVHEFVDRLAEQYADGWVKRLHHGAASVSNAMLDGGMIDYGSLTGLDGWTKFLTVGNGTPFGDLGDPEQWILEQWVKDLHKNVPEPMRSRLPSVEAAKRRFRESYARSLPERMLMLTGAPAPLVDAAKREPRARELGKLLVEMAEAGNETVYRNDGKIPPDAGKYNMAKVLEALARGTPLTAADVADVKLRDRLEGLHSDFVKTIAPHAAAVGVNTASMRSLMAERAKVLLRKLPETYATHERFEEWWGKWGEYERTRDRRAMQHYLDRRIENNTRTFRDASPWEAVVDQRSDPEHGITVRSVFDGRAGKFVRVIRLAESSGHVNFFGDIIPTAELVGSQLSHGGRRVPAVKGQGYTEFRLEGERESGMLELTTKSGKKIVARGAARFVGCNGDYSTL